MVGANHRSSSMSLRDRLFIEEDHVPGFLEKMRHAGFEQAMLLSTCDRVEIQAVHDDPEAAAEAVEHAEKYFGRLKRAPRNPPAVRTIEIKQQAEKKERLLIPDHRLSLITSRFVTSARTMHC